MKHISLTCFISILLSFVLTSSLTACTSSSTKDVNGTTNTFETTICTEIHEEAIETTAFSEEMAPSEPEFITFSDDITFSLEPVEKDDLMPYVLISPSCANPNTKSAVIVWLHGSGTVRCNLNAYMQRGLPKIMSEWRLSGFNSYIICPVLAKTNSWTKSGISSDIRALLEDFKSNHNVDPERIYLAGHSLGGIGAVYHSVDMADVFSKSVALSPYLTKMNYDGISIPLRVYTGMSEYGEDFGSVQFTQEYLVPVLGEDNCFELPESHGSLPEAAFYLDEDNNNQSDIIEWLFSEK